MLSAIKAGGNCDPEFSPELNQLISEYRDWQRRVQKDIDAGVQRWSNNDETKDKLKNKQVGFTVLQP